MPSPVLLKKWAKKVLQKKTEPIELNIRIVDIPEITALNQQYRHKTGPTNVLSFPFDMPEEIDEVLPILGDIVVCAEIVNEEAKTQSKSIQAHWAHMIVHSTLHLLGYDHETESDADLMESQEIAILATLGFTNPYQSIEKAR
jgi:probable rRNA maturation factor